MSKVITVSRQFMKGHPKAGQPTFFVEKIWKSLLDMDAPIADYIYDVGQKLGGYQYADDVLMAVDNSTPKHHTIRGGKRFKTGDKVSLRVWSDKPYKSKQIIIAPDVTLTVKDFEMNKHGIISVDAERLHYPFNIELTRNDGLSFPDFNDWFSKLPFSGQILIWNNNNLPY